MMGVATIARPRLTAGEHGELCLVFQTPEWK